MVKRYTFHLPEARVPRKIQILPANIDIRSKCNIKDRIRLKKPFSFGNKILKIEY